MTSRYRLNLFTFIAFAAWLIAPFPAGAQRPAAESFDVVVHGAAADGAKRAIGFVTIDAVPFLPRSKATANNHGERR